MRAFQPRDNMIRGRMVTSNTYMPPQRWYLVTHDHREGVAHHKTGLWLGPHMYHQQPGWGRRTGVSQANRLAIHGWNTGTLAAQQQNRAQCGHTRSRSSSKRACAEFHTMSVQDSTENLCSDRRTMEGVLSNAIKPP